MRVNSIPKGILKGKEAKELNHHSCIYKNQYS